ncbi:MAG: PHP domain-containing protein [Nocardioides sp.]|uniref:PHP domain-containing protein n=1 Tax=Nocardioides sp. TaxID=35761 RepID=UPI0039E5031D
MRIDLHTHSDVSDGTMAPGEVVRAAAAAGLDVVGLTDHDTAAGWATAEAAALETGISLVRGLEISTRFGGRGVHLLGYLVDPTYPPLVEALGKILDGRSSRVPAILERLRGLGIDIDVADVRRVAPHARATGRPHIADALVEAGVVSDRAAAFRELLNPGRPAYVQRYAADLEDMIGLVTAAGGVAVIAHPWGRQDPSVLSEEGLARLRQVGLAGVEVDHQDHSPADRERLRAIARELELVATGSSDFHGTGKVNHELGCHTTEVEEFERLIALADAAAAASGRVTPHVVVE